MEGLMSWSIREKIGWRKGPWTPEEDKLLSGYVTLHGEGRWSSVAKCAGLNRSGKSCRLRWVNYLRPGLKRGQITPQEEAIIIELHALWGNKWSTIARYLPGRTDNEIKNFWRTHFKNKDKSYQQKQLILRKRRSRVLKEKLQNDKLQAQESNTKTTPQTGVTTEPEAKTTSTSIDHRHLQTELDDNMHALLTNPTWEGGSASLFPWSDAVADHEYGSWGGLLWSLEDNNIENLATTINGHINGYCGDINHANKLNDITPIQHQARAFSTYSGSGYIF